MASNLDQIITFGSKKGMSLRNFLSDKGYLKWMKTQPGMWERFEKQYNINVVNIVSTFQNIDQPTPEHNKLQNKFLSKEFIDKYLYKSWDLSGIVYKFNKNLEQKVEELDELMKNEKFFRLNKYNNFEIGNVVKPDNPRVIFETQSGWDVMLRFDRDYYTPMIVIQSESVEESLSVKPEEFEIIPEIKKELYGKCYWNGHMMCNWERFFQLELFPDLKDFEKLDYIFNSKIEISEFYRLVNWSNTQVKEILNKKVEEKIVKLLRPFECLKIQSMEVILDGLNKIDIIVKYKALQSNDVSDQYIEIKTTVGDEYPCILRECKSRRDAVIRNGVRNGIFILLVDDLTAESVTREEFVQIFRQEGFYVYFFEEFEECDEEDILEKKIAGLEADLEKLKNRRNSNKK